MTADPHGPIPGAVPPVPWTLRGPVVVVPGLVAAARARSRVPGAARVLPVARGRAVALLALADYRQGSTLRYGELAALVGPALAGSRVGGWVDTMLVDDLTSLRGGHELWNVPKQMSHFTWTGAPPHAVAVHTADGELVVAARWSPPRRTLAVPLWAPFLGGLDGSVVAGLLTGVLRVGLGPVTLEVPPGSPLAALELTGARRALIGEVRARARGGRRPA